VSSGRQVQGNVRGRRSTDVSLLTVRQAAKRASVSSSLIYEWCAEKRLPHLRLGKKGRRGRVLIEETDLAAFMESCRVAAEEQPQVKPPAPKVAGAFQNLDAGRLQEAWRKQGVLGD
jgi:excisionase family DNA binding protein